MDSTLECSIQQPITEFFAHQSVFITGGSGFLGKVLVEKLLRSCPQTGKIYLLMRPKKGLDPQERLQKLTDIPLFEKVRQEQPDCLSKLHIINGDVAELDLGMKPEDWRMLQEQVSIVFHMAASVRFNDPIVKAILINVRGTREVLRLACGMKNLKIFLHVSTSYCNLSEKVVYEKLYKAAADWRTMIEMAETLDPFQLRIITSKILGEYPNTYTFAKGLAEHLINDYRDKLPVTIFRPSVVVSSFKEPFIGWIDNFNGPIGLLIAGGTGLLHTLYIKQSISIDYIPVDITCKSMIAVSWYEAHQRQRNITIYHCTAYNFQRITQKEFSRISYYIGEQVPFLSSIFHRFVMETDNFIVFYFIYMLTQYLPAVLIDSALALAGKKPRLLRIQRKIFNASMCLSYFTLNSWDFYNKNFNRLNDLILSEDQEAFQYTSVIPNPYEFFMGAALAGRELMLNEKKETIPEAHRHMKRLMILHYGICGLLFTLLLWLVSSRYTITI